MHGDTRLRRSDPRKGKPTPSRQAHDASRPRDVHSQRWEMR